LSAGDSTHLHLESAATSQDRLGSGDSGKWQQTKKAMQAAKKKHQTKAQGKPDQGAAQDESSNTSLAPVKFARVVLIAIVHDSVAS
jgi:hypothetical protein